MPKAKRERGSRRYHSDPAGFWYRTATPEERQRVDKVLRPSDHSVLISHNFYCDECVAMTPQAYTSVKDTDEYEWTMSERYRYAQICREMRCIVCDTTWLHRTSWPTCGRHLIKAVKTRK